MITLHKWLNNLVDNFTFYGGGGKGGGDGESTTQQGIDPMLNLLFNTA